MAEAILRRLRFPNDVTGPVCEMIRQHMNYMNVKSMRVAKLKRFMARPTFTCELELHRVDCASSNGLMDNYDFLRAKRDDFARAPLIPARFLTGEDVLARGWHGPDVGRLLTEAQTLQLEGKLTGRDNALAWLESHSRPSPG